VCRCGVLFDVVVLLSDLLLYLPGEVQQRLRLNIDGEDDLLHTNLNNTTQHDTRERGEKVREEGTSNTPLLLLFAVAVVVCAPLV
jgi:hypothetical protein